VRHYTIVTIGIFLLSIFVFTGCQTTYYAVWEKLGKEKRHLLKDQVEKAAGEQEKASEQFKDVLSRIKEMYGFSGGDLEEFYDRLKDDYEACEERAESVRSRIDRVEQIGGDLFLEWEKEINEITNQKLKTKSRQSLAATQTRFQRLQKAMAKAESKLNPVLRDLRDYVLYLKHNLNARSIGALKKEADDIEVEVGALLKEIGKSISEAEEFVKHFQ